MSGSKKKSRKKRRRSESSEDSDDWQTTVSDYFNYSGQVAQSVLPTFQVFVYFLYWYQCNGQIQAVLL